jgi:hypothetical protein
MSRETIMRAVGKRHQPTSMTPRVARRLRSYFESYGVEFLPDGQVRIKQAAQELPE